MNWRNGESIYPTELRRDYSECSISDLIIPDYGSWVVVFYSSSQLDTVTFTYDITIFESIAELSFFDKFWWLLLFIAICAIGIGNSLIIKNRKSPKNVDLSEKSIDNFDFANSIENSSQNDDKKSITKNSIDDNSINGDYIYCYNCGKRNTKGNRFCGHCGRIIFFQSNLENQDN